MRESAIETKVCEYAKAKGWLVYKFVSPNQKGVPDRMFIGGGDMFLIEFKALGKKPTKLQEKTFAKIRKELFEVYIIDNVADGKTLIDNLSLIKTLKG